VGSFLPPHSHHYAQRHKWDDVSLLAQHHPKKKKKKKDNDQKIVWVLLDKDQGPVYCVTRDLRVEMTFLASSALWGENLKPGETDDWLGKSSFSSGFGKNSRRFGLPFLIFPSFLPTFIRSQPSTLTSSSG